MNAREESIENIEDFEDIQHSNKQFFSELLSHCEQYFKAPGLWISNITEHIVSEESEIRTNETIFANNQTIVDLFNNLEDFQFM